MQTVGQQDNCWFNRMLAQHWHNNKLSQLGKEIILESWFWKVINKLFPNFSVKIHLHQNSKSVIFILSNTLNKLAILCHQWTSDNQAEYLENGAVRLASRFLYQQGQKTIRTNPLSLGLTLHCISYKLWIKCWSILNALTQIILNRNQK